MAASSRPTISSLVKLFESNNGIGSYVPYRTVNVKRDPYDYIIEKHQYYQPALSANGLLKKLVGTAEPIDAILQRNKQEKNALHYLLSTDIYSWSLDPRNFYYYSTIVFRPEDEDVKEGEIVTLYKQTHSQSIWANIPIDKQNQLINRYKLGLLKVILSFFPDNAYGNEKLFSALFHPDKKGDSILHLIFKNIMIDVIELLLSRIAKMSDQQKYELASAFDSGRRTIFHYIAEKSNAVLFKKIIDAFGSQCIRAIMTIRDEKYKNILHAASECLDGEARFKKITYFCGFLKAIRPDEVKEVLPITSVFQLDADGHSPLTTFCSKKSREEKLDRECIKIFVDTLQDDYVDLLTMQDREGRNGLHLAAESKSVSTFKALLEAIPLESKKTELILVENDRHDTVWHSALSSGEPELLQSTFKLLDKDQLFKLDDSPRTPQAITEGKLIGLYEKEKAQRLSSFCFVEYVLLQVTTRHKFTLWQINSVALMADARACILAKKTGKPCFLINKVLMHDKEYNRLRNDFWNYATVTDLDACERYFDLNKKYPEAQKALATLFSRESPSPLEKKAEPVVVPSTSVPSLAPPESVPPSYGEAMSQVTVAPVVFVPGGIPAKTTTTVANPQPSAPELPPAYIEAAMQSMTAAPNRDLSQSSIFAAPVVTSAPPTAVSVSDRKAMAVIPA